jgi:hypothetical protein
MFIATVDSNGEVPTGVYHQESKGVMSMKTIKLSLLLALGIAAGAYAVEKGDREVTFAVGCYDVGASALQGQPGVISVEKGWHGGREVDRVVFDPAKISVPAMEERLKGAGTYIGTEPSSSRDQGRGNQP